MQRMKIIECFHLTVKVLIVLKSYCHCISLVLSVHSVRTRIIMRILLRLPGWHLHYITS